MIEEEWIKLCERLGYKFQHPLLLKQALTHKSFVSDKTEANVGNNERIEFLGDAVLDLVISEMLIEKFPEMDEGGLSKFRASLVSEHGLSQLARQLELGRCLLLGRGEEVTGGREKPSLLADTFEAVLAAVYLDSREEYGISIISQIIQNLFLPHLPENADGYITRDYKSELQEYVQKLSGVPSTYKVIEESGPDHDKEFTMAVYIREKEYGRGVGPTKKMASQIAAENALLRIKKEPSFLQIEKIS